MADAGLAALVEEAADGDAGAWNGLVERFSPLLWSIARSYGLSGRDAEEVVQTSWLRLLDHLTRLAEPAGAGTWLAATVRQESVRQARRLGSGQEQGAPGGDGLARAFADLSGHCQQLLRLRAAGASDAEIGAALGMPVDAIGPATGRCLERLRRRMAVAADSEAS